MRWNSPWPPPRRNATRDGPNASTSLSVEPSADFREHIKITEGPDGLYHELMQTVPRLSGAVARFTREHNVITGLLGDLLDTASTPTASQDVDHVRDLGMALFGRLLRHRQRGSDLCYEAFQIDIGGET